MEVYRIVDAEEAERAYPCMTEGPTPWDEGLPLSRQWFAENLGEYVEGFHLQDDAGNVIGHIYWAPSDRALVPYRIEDGVAFMYCEWVQRAHRRKGYGRMLFDAFVEALRAEGYKGVLVDGTDYEGYMHYSHFEKRDFRVIREADSYRLMWLPLTQEAVQVEPLAPKVTPEGIAPVEVLIIGAHFCPVGASAVLSVRKVVQEFGDQVALREVPAGREALERYGWADGIFINGQAKFMGPTTEEQIRQAIAEELGEAAT